LGAVDDTVWAVVLGAVLATLGGFAATQLEAYFRRREMERGAALLFGEILSVVELLMVLADEARGRGDPYGAMTMRLLRAARRETETYDRNRESLYDLKDASVRAEIHTMMVRITLSMDGAFEAHDEIVLLEAAGVVPESDEAARLGRLREQRQGSFDFALEAVDPIRKIVAALRPMARQPFGDHDAIARSYL
jgi:hypothetical protein